MNVIHNELGEKAREYAMSVHLAPYKQEDLVNAFVAGAVWCKRYILG